MILANMVEVLPTLTPFKIKKKVGNNYVIIKTKKSKEYDYLRYMKEPVRRVEYIEDIFLIELKG